MLIPKDCKMSANPILWSNCESIQEWKCLKLNRKLSDILPSSKWNNSSQQAHSQASLGVGIGNRVLGGKKLKTHLPAISVSATLVSYGGCS